MNVEKPNNILCICGHIDRSHNWAGWKENPYRNCAICKCAVFEPADPTWIGGHGA